MSDFTSGNVPGSQTKIEAEESEVTWAGRCGQDLVATRRVTLDAAAVDSGNSPTTTLRGGNLLALVDASGKAHTYDPDANDGRQMAVGILEHYQNMLLDGVAADRFTQILVHGLVKESELVGLDPRGKQQLGARFVFDRDLAASLGVLMHPRGIYRKSANYVVTAADNGLLLSDRSFRKWRISFWGRSLRRFWRGDGWWCSSMSLGFQGILNLVTLSGVPPWLGSSTSFGRSRETKGWCRRGTHYRSVAQIFSRHCSWLISLWAAGVVWDVVWAVL